MAHARIVLGRGIIWTIVRVIDVGAFVRIVVVRQRYVGIMTGNFLAPSRQFEHSRQRSDDLAATRRHQPAEVNQRSNRGAQFGALFLERDRSASFAGKAQLLFTIVEVNVSGRRIC